MASNTVYLLPPKKEIIVEGEVSLVKGQSLEQPLRLPINRVTAFGGLRFVEVRFQVTSLDDLMTR
jgi:hypothetical protein